MKQLLTILFLGASVWMAQGQEASPGRIFKPFKVDVSLGYAIPQGTGAKGGLIFAVEPKYAVTEAISVGLRLEGAAMVRGLSNTNDPDNLDGEVSAAGSYLATGDYYFSTNKFRPFLGGGFGLYQIASATIVNGSSNLETPSSSEFGGMIRGGFEAGHFRLGVEYNFVPETTFQNNTFKNGYLGIKLGVCIGGGRYVK
jgi:outer membrane protein X